MTAKTFKHRLLSSDRHRTFSLHNTSIQMNKIKVLSSSMLVSYILILLFGKNSLRKFFFDFYKWKMK